MAHHGASGIPWSKGGVSGGIPYIWLHEAREEYMVAEEYLVAYHEAYHGAREEYMAYHGQGSTWQTMEQGRSMGKSTWWHTMEHTMGQGRST